MMKVEIGKFHAPVAFERRGEDGSYEALFAEHLTRYESALLTCATREVNIWVPLAQAVAFVGGVVAVVWWLL